MVSRFVRCRLVVLLSLLLITGSTLAQESPFEPIAAIRDAAIAAVGSDGQVEVRLDPALQLPRCNGPLQGRANSGTTVEVSCTDPAGWRLFVPVKVRRAQAVVVLTRTVPAGTVISADAVSTESRDMGRVTGGSLAVPADAVGKTARRTLVAGAVLSPADLVAVRLVRRGDTVTLVSGAGGIEVRASGRALGDAGESERLSVENLSSHRILQGYVGANGEVRVGR